MEFTHYDKLSDADDVTQKQVRDLTLAADNSFVPPLSSRTGTTQVEFGREGGNRTPSSSGESAIDVYFNQLLGQSIIVITDSSESDSVLVGYLSYIPHYSDARNGISECVYVSTVLLNEEYRGQRLTYDLYSALFTRVMDSGAPVVTRTWRSADPKKSNEAHIHILEQLGFEQTKCLSDHRGKGIDTVYFTKTFVVEGYSLLQKIRAYHLTGPILATILLFLVTAAFTIAYAALPDRESVSAEIVMAFATSLLVSAVVLIVDIVTMYKSIQREEYLNDIQRFGIERLNFNKQAYLMRRIYSARSCVWMTGYRHILTSSVSYQLRKAAARGVTFQMIICPPWSDAFRLVYGDEMKVVSNYVKVLRTLLTTARLEDVEVRFIDKVMFNDIYRVDETFITSPYNHAPKKGIVTTARDFFTIIISEDSRLNRVTAEEYGYLWDTAVGKLDNARFLEVFSSDRFTDMPVEEKVERLRSCVVGMD